MKTLSTLIILLYGFVITIPEDYHYMKKIEKNGMTVSWKFNEERIEFVVTAPTKGWVAIGFNEQNQLVGNHLVMGKVQAGEVTLSDRYVVGVGNHQAVESLGGINHLADIQGEERLLCTNILFSLPIKAMDDYHIDLVEHKQIHLLLAYSQVDDFEHHSIMRTSVSVEL